MTDEQRAEPSPAAEAPVVGGPAVEENEKTAERAPRGPGDTAERKPLAAPPPAYVRLHLQGNVLLSMITPKVLIDGHPAPAKYGENLYPVAPGPHLVSAHAQWMWQYGQAEQQDHHAGMLLLSGVAVAFVAARLIFVFGI